MDAETRRRRFLELTLIHRFYEDDDGGRQPELRAAIVRDLLRVARGQLPTQASLRILEAVLTDDRDATRAILSFEDVLAVGLLTARYPSEPGSPLRVVSDFAEVVWTRMMQSTPLRRAMNLDDSLSTLFPLEPGL